LSFPIAQGTSEVVKLQRMATSMIADKKKLFEILTKIVDRCKRDKDAEMIKHLEEAIELWTQMMLEEHDQDMKSEANVAKMQQSCDEWLEELLILLSNGEVALWTDEGTIKTARNPQSVRTLFASEAGELDNLRSQLAVAREPVREQLLALRAELDEVNSSLLTATNDVTTLNRHKSKLQEELSLLQKEVEKKNGTIDELKKCISDLDTWVNMSKSELDLVRSTFVRCRQLIAQTRARVAENPMPEVEVVTHCDKEPTTVRPCHFRNHMCTIGCIVVFTKNWCHIFF
jgi:chromosome segregation ATPase